MQLPGSNQIIQPTWSPRKSRSNTYMPSPNSWWNLLVPSFWMLLLGCFSLLCRKKSLRFKPNSLPYFGGYYRKETYNYYS